MMKKNLFYLFALICSMSLFTACDDDETVVDYAEAIAGTYTGTLYVEVYGTTTSVENQKVAIVKASANTVNLIISDFSFSGIEVGDVIVSNCVVTKDGDDYDFPCNDSVTVLGMEAVITGDGEVEGGNQLDIDLDISVNGGQISVDVDFTGTK